MIGENGAPSLKYQQAKAAEAELREANHYGDGAHVIRMWREAGEPKEGLRLAAEVLALPMRDEERASVKTTQGGCYKDLDQLEEAEACGLEAIRLNPDVPHPYNLLWSVYRKLWRLYHLQEHWQKADEHLRKAEELSRGLKTVKIAQLM